MQAGKCLLRALLLSRVLGTERNDLVRSSLDPLVVLFAAG
jgi:hypothetical protein